MRFFTYQGTGIRLIAMRNQEEVWAWRTCDGELRCYHLSQVKVDADHDARDLMNTVALLDTLTEEQARKATSTFGAL